MSKSLCSDIYKSYTLGSADLLICDSFRRLLRSCWKAISSIWLAGLSPLSPGWDISHSSVREARSQSHNNSWTDCNTVRGTNRWHCASRENRYARRRDLEVSGISPPQAPDFSYQCDEKVSFPFCLWRFGENIYMWSKAFQNMLLVWWYLFFYHFFFFFLICCWVLLFLFACLVLLSKFSWGFFCFVF